ncbi:MAG: hypothetical protein ABIO86_12990 [Sphingomonas sp.]
MIQIQRGSLQHGTGRMLRGPFPLFDMTGFIIPVSTAVPVGNSAVPPLLFPTFTAVIQEQQREAYPFDNEQKIQPLKSNITAAEKIGANNSG